MGAVSDLPGSGMVAASESVVDAMISRWRKARLSKGEGALGFPTENVISKAGKGRVLRPPPMSDAELTDAEVIQTIVNEMPYEPRSVFEAYYLGMIRGQRCNRLPHKARALVLGIGDSTYRRRRRFAYRYCQVRVGDFFDNVTAFLVETG